MRSCLAEQQECIDNLDFGMRSLILGPCFHVFQKNVALGFEEEDV